MDITALQNSVRAFNGRLAFSGTDYGIRIMSQTVAQSAQEVEGHINRFQRLLDLEDTNLEHVEELADLKLPTSFKTTSTQIDSITNTPKMNTKLQQAKKLKEEAVIAQKTISEHSLKRTETMQDVENVQEHRRLARIPMRSVNPARISPSHLKLKHTQGLRSKRALDIAANERKYVHDHTLAKDNE
ncbi:hypothetical protein BGX31_008235, partial [Mortierella sp. GBA43]